MRQILLLSVILVAVESETVLLKRIVSPTRIVTPCDDKDIKIRFEQGFRARDNIWYYLYVNKSFPKNSNVTIVFNTGVYITFISTTDNHEYSRKTLLEGDTFSLQLVTPQTHFGFRVDGTERTVVPHLLSLSVNGVQYCNNPKLGFLEQYVAKSRDSFPCGRRLEERTVVNGEPTHLGDWPWHAAVFRLTNTKNEYVCGGTLISKNFVVTAAHCVSLRGNVISRDIVTAVLGKQKLFENELQSQQMEVLEIILHKHFQYTTLYNDIALLELRKEAVFNNFVQPICLWHRNDVKKLPSDKISGTFVGWGFDEYDMISEILQQVTLPKISDVDCRSSNIRFAQLLNGKNFCAGFRDGTSPCNGDSGGGYQVISGLRVAAVRKLQPITQEVTAAIQSFYLKCIQFSNHNLSIRQFTILRPAVFIPDEIQSESNKTSGTWHIRGILSSAIAGSDNTCDTRYYVVFTDLEKFRDWIDQYLE